MRLCAIVCDAGRYFGGLFGVNLLEVGSHDIGWLSSFCVVRPVGGWV